MRPRTLGELLARRSGAPWVAGEQPPDRGAITGRREAEVSVGKARPPEAADEVRLRIDSLDPRSIRLL
jgi:hypothetical protein